MSILERGSSSILLKLCLVGIALVVEQTDTLITPASSGDRSSSSSSSLVNTNPQTFLCAQIGDSVCILSAPATRSPVCEIVFIAEPQLSNCKDACWESCLLKRRTKIVLKPVVHRLVQEIPNARILLLSYDPSDFHWTGKAVEIEDRSFGESLLREMVESARIGQYENCPIVFVCQSLGVPQLKEAVFQGCEAHSLDSKYQSFLHNIGGFLFYASPYDSPTPTDVDSHVHVMVKAITIKISDCTLNLFCRKKKLRQKAENEIVRRVNSRFEQLRTTVKFSTGWRIENVPEAKHTALHRLGDIMGMCMGSMPLSTENFGVSKPKSNKASKNVLFKLVHATISKSETKNNFKLSMSKLLNSTREVQKRIIINVSQCNRLVDRIADVIKELEVHESILEGEDLAKVHECFLILLNRSRSLVEECGGSEWVETALVRRNNKEAFEEVHKELTKFLCKYADFSRIASFNVASGPPEASLLDEDAARDLHGLLEKLESYKGECGSEIFNPEQPLVVQHLGKILEVVLDKSKDEGSTPIGERDSSASYLQIPESEIVIKKHIGTGSYGEVHKAEWLGCKVCLKDFPWSGGYGEQWLLQAMPLLRLRHPNVLQLVGFSPSSLVDDSKPQPKVLTEIMQGDIRSLIDRTMEKQNGKGTPFKRCMTLDIMTQVARGLDCMHTNGFMHGDRVLTTNIIIKVFGDYIDARIGDFGVPLDVPVQYVHVFEPRMGDPEGTETARWMAPEVCARAARYSPASDMYSFGIFCYEVLTGRKPFDDYDDVVAIYAQILAGKLRPELPGDLDERVADIIQKCWHADPSSRPEARAVVDALEASQFPVTAII